MKKRSEEKNVGKEENLLFESVFLLSLGTLNAKVLQLLLVTFLLQFDAVLNVLRHLLLAHL